MLEDQKLTLHLEAEGHFHHGPESKVPKDMSWIGRLKEEIASDICSRQWEDRRTYERRITRKKGLGDGTTQVRARAEKQSSKIPLCRSVEDLVLQAIGI